MTSYPDLRGKCALVTGGNRGIGRAIAHALAHEGVDVAVVGRSHAEDAEAAAAEVAERGVRSHFALADLTLGSEVDRVLGETLDALGRIDILVNCAGGFMQRRTLLETTEEDWDGVITANLRSAFLVTKGALPGMIERGWGRIVNISSGSGRMPTHVTATAYATSKAGLLGFTRHLAREVAEHGITVNATAPGTTVTGRSASLATPERRAAAAASTPIGRVSEAHEQAGAVVFLASEAAAYITGATIDINGGKIML